MNFQYPHNIRTIEEALYQGIFNFAQQHAYPVPIDPAEARASSEELLDEIRTILTGELATLLDGDGVAEDWNDAIEQAIRLVEGSLQ